ncbi:MAG: 4-hydroxy-3-methylbut-2-enyl diphosphate reductase [Bacteroidota bacterium]
MRKYQSRNLKKAYDLGQYAPLYRSKLLGKLKQIRPSGERLAPINLDFGPIRFLIARHFGFCKGVENAIEVAYETLEKHQDRRVFMISELIHNSFVNADLQQRGLRFIKTAKGEQLIPWEEIKADDVVITPAFGASVEDIARLRTIGVDIQKWNATCRFVENVWFRAKELGEQGYTVIIHGKFKHEETQATFSHSRVFTPTVVVKDMKESQILSQIILGHRSIADFERYFSEKATPGFDPTKDLERIAVVNQTTMLATETAAISAHFAKAMEEKFGSAELENRVANTRDTLCYATKNNQSATTKLLQEKADLAIVIGGHNSSNTSHLVELCEEKLPTYFIESESDILSAEKIRHYAFREAEEHTIAGYLPIKEPLTVLITSGASCPDAIVEKVLDRLLSFFPRSKTIMELMEERQSAQKKGGEISPASTRVSKIA